MSDALRDALALEAKALALEAEANAALDGLYEEGDKKMDEKKTSFVERALTKAEARERAKVLTALAKWQPLRLAQLALTSPGVDVSTDVEIDAATTLVRRMGAR